MKQRTDGIATKVLAACGVQLIALVVNLIGSGEFDRVELAQVIGLALTAVVGYAAPASPVVSK